MGDEIRATGPVFEQSPLARELNTRIRREGYLTAHDQEMHADLGRRNADGEQLTQEEKGILLLLTFLQGAPLEPPEQYVPAPSSGYDPYTQSGGYGQYGGYDPYGPGDAYPMGGGSSRGVPHVPPLMAMQRATGQRQREQEVAARRVTDRRFWLSFAVASLGLAVAVVSLLVALTRPAASGVPTAPSAPVSATTSPAPPAPPG